MDLRALTEMLVDKIVIDPYPNKIDEDGRHRYAHSTITIRIGLTAGKAVTENGDLFGEAVQLAAHLGA